jgi:predicted RNA-binding Zn-ribbon protein involved in translation (DUF1610 family)
MSRFSPYHLSAASQIATLALLACVVFIFATGLDPLFALLAAALGLILQKISLIFACPRCGKRVRDYDPRIGGTWLSRRRIWPERTCSSCGSALDGI